MPAAFDENFLKTKVDLWVDAELEGIARILGFGAQPTRMPWETPTHNEAQHFQEYKAARARAERGGRRGPAMRRWQANIILGSMELSQGLRKP
eukprot:1821561-Alexandrium_andersonii.AAC.1